MKIKNQEWLDFKMRFLGMVQVLTQEFDNFIIPEDADNFELYVDDCLVHPVFIKKPEELKVQYDFTLCNTKIRLLTLSIYKDSGRIEMSLKNEEDINYTI